METTNLLPKECRDEIEARFLTLDLMERARNIPDLYSRQGFKQALQWILTEGDETPTGGA